MAFIIKGGKSLKDMDRKSIYTWSACAVVFFFVIVTMLSAMGGDEGKADQFEGLQSRGLDLAQLSMITDEAEKEILARYNDIASNPVTEAEALYSEEEKEARIAEDLELGEPIPDEEYAIPQKETRTKTPVARPSIPRTPTPIGTLQSGRGMSTGGGGKGSASYTPGNLNNNSNYNNKNNSKNNKITANAEALNKLKNNRDLMGAYAGTRTAATKDGEAAAKGALDAFMGGKAQAELDGDIEKAMTELSGDEMVGKAQMETAKLPNSDASDKIKEKGKEADAKAKADDKKAASQAACNEWYCPFTDALKNALNTAANSATEKTLDNYLGKRGQCNRLAKKEGSGVSAKDCLKY